jgi:hypothetical protein
MASRSIIGFVGFAACLAACFDLSTLTSGTHKPPVEGPMPDLAGGVGGVAPDASDLAIPPLDDLAPPPPPPDLALPIIHDLSGACALASDEGKVCDPTTNPCKTAGVCHNYVCQPQGNAGAGKVCDPASNACHTDGTCDGNGHCGGQGTRPESFNWNPSNFHARCCGGNPTTVDTAQNCGACGINCNGGACENLHGELYCTCNSNAQCWSKCCSIAYGTPWTCAAGDCNTNQMISCPGGATNSDNPNPGGGPYYCHY